VKVIEFRTKFLTWYA